MSGKSGVATTHMMSRPYCGISLQRDNVVRADHCR